MRHLLEGGTTQRESLISKLGKWAILLCQNLVIFFFQNKDQT